MQEKDITPAQNPTINRDAAITGGEQKIVINHITVRQAQRQSADVGKYKDTILMAESATNPRFAPLYDIYHHYYTLDDHVSGSVEKRIKKVINKDLHYYSPDGKPVHEMRKTIKGEVFRAIMTAIAESTIWGRSGIEFEPGKTLRIRSIPRKHIDMKNQRILFDQNGQEGIDYTSLDNVWIIGNPNDLGVLLSTTLYSIYKLNAIGDWAQFLEIYGMPSRVGYYDPQDTTTRDTLEQIFETAGANTDIVAPNTAQVKIEDGKSSNANGDLQAKFVDMMDKQNSIKILGQTDTTSGKGGSLAKAKVHQGEEDQIIIDDIANMEAKLSNEHFMRILQSYGYPVEIGGYFEFRKEINPTALKERAETDQILQGMGTPIPLSYITDTYGIPEVTGDEEVLQAPQAMQASAEEIDPKTGKPKPAGSVTVRPSNRRDKKTEPQDLSDEIDYNKLATAIAAKMKGESFFD